MELILLDDSFNSVCAIDSFESLIWTDRYNEYGDFELYLFVNEDILQNVKLNYYFLLENAEVALVPTVMIIEEIELETDIEKGDHLKISGRSLESILDRRIVWSKTVLNGSLQSQIKKIIEENIISPTNTDRKISNFIFVDTEDPYIAEQTINAQFTGDKQSVATDIQ